jgi:CheY-like chemotaxis protein
MKTILYVEDHPPARMLMQAIIEDLTDFTLIEAEDGAQAVTLARQHRPDLYLLDMDLPDTDGLQLSRVLTALHIAPVVLVSAYAEAITPDNLNEQIQFYLAKPLDPDHVADTLRRAIS